jgi:hypothetical protein
MSTAQFEPNVCERVALKYPTGLPHAAKKSAGSVQIAFRCATTAGAPELNIIVIKTDLIVPRPIWEPSIIRVLGWDFA